MKRLHVVTSLRCNNRCVFCMEGDHAGEDLRVTRDMRGLAHDFLRPEELAEQLKDVRDSQTPILFTSGEPTINPHLLELVKLVRRKGFKKIALQTNGRMLSYKGQALKLIQAGVSEFAISIHGSRRAVHEGMTRAPGSFQQSLDGLLNVLSFKEQLPSAHLRVTTHTTLTRINMADLEALLRLLLSQPRLDALILNSLVPQGNAVRFVRQTMIPYSELISRFKEVVAALRADAVPGLNRISLTDIPFCVMRHLPDFIGSFERVMLVKSGGGLQDLGPRQSFPGRKRKACAKCVFTASCTGVHSYYLKWKGWKEFVPLRTLAHDSKKQVKK